MKKTRLYYEPYANCLRILYSSGRVEVLFFISPDPMGNWYNSAFSSVDYAYVKRQLEINHEFVSYI